MAVRAKFKVNKIEITESGKNIHFHPVTNSSEENKRILREARKKQKEEKLLREKQTYLRLKEKYENPQ